jgi:hypothetical protein
LKEAVDEKHDVRPKDALDYAADKGISRATVFRLFDKLANAGTAESVDGTKFPRVTHWRLIPETADPHTQTGETTETTGPDLHKQGETTVPLWHHSENTNETASDQQEQSNGAHVVSVVSPIPHDAPPGGITPKTPGMTDRVAAVLAKTAQQTQGDRT